MQNLTTLIGQQESKQHCTDHSEQSKPAQNSAEEFQAIQLWEKN